MGLAFGDARTFSASDVAKKMMKELNSKLLFKEQRDVWMLGAALGIAAGKMVEESKRETFQNVNSLDPDGVFAAIMIGLYSTMTPEERVNRLVDHAEWGIREIYRMDKNGTLDFSKLGT